MNRSTLMLLAAGLMVGTAAQGAVTYVDADTSNTFSALNSLITWNDGSAIDGDGAASNDGLWRYRSGFGNNGIWEATGSTATAEDAAEIVTSATVANATYNVYVFYYAVNETGDFPIRAGLASDPNNNAAFDRAGNKGTAGGDAIVDLTFDVAPPTGSETRTLFYGLIGETTVSDGTLEVYIDDWPASSTLSSNDRTWYAGIGYEAVPEPSSLALLGLGGLCVLRRRRNA